MTAQRVNGRAGDATVETSSSTPLQITPRLAVEVDFKSAFTDRHGITSVLIDCPFCGKEHRHGWPQGQRHPGWRGSHCGQGSYDVREPFLRNYPWTGDPLTRWR